MLLFEMFFKTKIKGILVIVVSAQLKNVSQNWIISPSRGEIKKMKPPPRIYTKTQWKDMTMSDTLFHLAVKLWKFINGLHPTSSNLVLHMILVELM